MSGASTDQWSASGTDREEDRNEDNKEYEDKEWVGHDDQGEYDSDWESDDDQPKDTRVEDREEPGREHGWSQTEKRGGVDGEKGRKGHTNGYYDKAEETAEGREEKGQRHGYELAKVERREEEERGKGRKGLTHEYYKQSEETAVRRKEKEQGKEHGWDKDKKERREHGWDGDKTGRREHGWDRDKTERRDVDAYGRQERKRHTNPYDQPEETDTRGWGEQKGLSKEHGGGKRRGEVDEAKGTKGHYDKRDESEHWWEEVDEEEAPWYTDDWPPAALTLEDFADSVIPPHIVAPGAYLQAQQQARLESLTSRRSYRARRRLPPTAKWKVQRADYNGWRRRTVDNQPGSIYAMKDNVLQSMSDESLQLSSEVRLQPYRAASDQQQISEKRYIQGLSDQAWDGIQGQGVGGGRGEDGNKDGADNLRFTLHIMRRYNKPARENRDPSYGAPAPSVPGPQKSMVSRLVEGVVRPPSSIHLVHSCVRPMHFQQPTSSSFCEVLGPTSCKECIEGTNRYTAHRVENLVFPTLPSNQPATALVVPKLTHIMARDNRRLTLKTHPPEGTSQHPVHHSPKTHARSRERAITLAIKKTSTKVGGAKRKEVSGPGVVLPVISQGLPTLSSTHKKKARVHVRLYDRRWEARAKDFFPEQDPSNQDAQREDSSLNLSEQQRRLRQMLENIKYKSAVGGTQPP